METQRTDWLTYAMLACTILFWSGNAIVGRAIRTDIDPVSLAFLRWVGASLVIAPFAWRGLRTDLPRIRACWKMTAVLCLTGVAGFNTLLYAGLQTTPATNALLVQALIPGLVLIFAAVAFGQFERGWKVTGIMLSVFGAMFTIFKGDIHSVLALGLGRGDLFVFAACLCWAVYTVLLRFAPQVRPATFLFVTFAGGALFLLPFVVLSSGTHVEWSWSTLAAIGYIAIFPSVAAYYLFNAAVARAGHAIAGQAITLMPLIGALLASLLLGEALHWYHGAGMALILLGIVTAAFSARRSRS